MKVLVCVRVLLVVRLQSRVLWCALPFAVHASQSEFVCDKCLHRLYLTVQFQQYVVFLLDGTNTILDPNTKDVVSAHMTVWGAAIREYMIARMNADPGLGLTPKGGLEYKSKGCTQKGISKGVSI